MTENSSLLSLASAKPVATWGEIPPRICGHIFVHLGKGLVACHGGFQAQPAENVEGSRDIAVLTKASAATYLLQVGLEGADGLLEWVRLVNRGHHVPSARGDHAGSAVNGKLVLFGGAEGLARDSALVDNELYVLDSAEDIRGCTWHKIQVEADAGEEGQERRPSARRGHSLVACGPEIILFGGVDGVGRQLNDLWALRTDSAPPFKWRRMLAAGQPPSPRSYHTMCGRADGFLVVFGGRGHADGSEGGTERGDVSLCDQEAASGFVIRSDVIGLMCSEDSWAWTRPTMSQHAAADIARCQHCAVFSGTKMYIHGGSSDGTLIANGWSVFDSTCSAWTAERGKVSAGIAAEGRYRHRVALVGAALFVLGGIDACGMRNDLYVVPLAHQDVPELSDPLSHPLSQASSPASANAPAVSGHQHPLPSGGIPLARNVGWMRQGTQSAGVQMLTGIDEVCPPAELLDLANHQPELLTEDHFAARRSTAEEIIKFLVGGAGDPAGCVWEVAGAGNPWQGQRVLLVPEQQRIRLGEALKWLCSEVAGMFEAEARVLEIKSPCHVFGDVHGNISDLCCLAEKFWPLGPSLNAGNFLFLGDYVDRGCNGPEVVAYLLAQKLLAPTKWFLLRGNHEIRSNNGVVHPAGFKGQCFSRFGQPEGLVVWEEVNKVFDRLPLAALVRDEIFCCHGGPPRPINRPDLNTSNGGEASAVTRLAALRQVPVPFDPDETDTGVEWLRVLALQVMWSDPATPSQEMMLEPDGFLPSGATCGLQEGVRMLAYGRAGVAAFLAENRLSRVLRGHSAIARGVQMESGGRVMTIFSESKNHMKGEQARCGCVLVEESIQVIVGRTA